MGYRRRESVRFKGIEVALQDTFLLLDLISARDRG